MGILIGALKKGKRDIGWFRVIEEGLLLLYEYYHGIIRRCSIHQARRNGVCTIQYLRAELQQ